MASRSVSAVLLMLVTPCVARAQQAEETMGSDQLGLALLRAMHRAGENLFLSPASISMALQMTAGAATDETRQEMIDAMGVAGVDLGPANRRFLDRLRAGDDFALAIANSLWANADVMTIKPEFAAECAKFYAAEVRALSFADAGTLGAINGWVATHTGGKIPTLIDRIAPDAASYLINAIHFRGAWTHPFGKSATKDADFTLVSGKTVRVRMMSMGERLPYLEAKRYRAVGLPFGENESATLWVIVPALVGLADVVRDLDAKELASIVRAPLRRGRVGLPRFQLRSQHELSGPLVNLGMKRAFEAGRAQFDRLGNDGGRGFVISRVLHEAVLEVDEKGATAAAATAVEMRAGAAPERDVPFELVANQPFLVAITHRATSALLFVGAVYEPTSE